jgi:hypothetical protein
LWAAPPIYNTPSTLMDPVVAAGDPGVWTVTILVNGVLIESETVTAT